MTIEIITVLFECFLVHIFLSSLFYYRERKISIIISCYLAFSLILVTLSILPVYPIARLIYIFVGVFLISQYLFDTKLISAIYAALAFCVIAIFDELVCLLVLNLIGLDTQSLMVQGNNRSIYLVFAKIIHLSLILSISRIFTRREDKLNWKQLFPLLFCQLFSIYFCYNLYLWSNLLKDDYQTYILVAPVGILYMNIIIIIFVEVMKHNAEMKRKQSLTEQQYDLQRRYYEQIWKEQDETRALWHDINKYMTAMKAMVAVGNEAEAEQVMSDAQSAFSKVKAAVDVSDPSVSAILNYNLQHANSAGIQVDMDIWIPSECKISAVDLSIIIGNTFDNAIEACSDMTGRKISIMLKMKQDMLFYEISNPCSKQDSSKKSGKYHGYGLKNVKRCVEKYNGSVAYGINNGTFSVSIRLNLSKN